MSTSKWRNYGVWKLRSQLNFLEHTDAQVYEIRDQSGQFVCSFYHQHLLKRYQSDEFQIILLDKEEYINQLKEQLKKMQNEQ